MSDKTVLACQVLTSSLLSYKQYITLRFHLLVLPVISPQNSFGMAQVIYCICAGLRIFCKNHGTSKADIKPLCSGLTGHKVAAYSVVLCS
jgi:hypothetical protein